MHTPHFLLAASLLVLAACHPAEHGHDHAHEGHDHKAEAAHHGHEGHDHEDEAAEVHADSDEIIVPADKARAAGVETAVVRPAPFRHVIPASGRLVAAQADETTVVASTSGIVGFRTVLTEGMAVRQGTPLISLSARALQGGAPAERARVDYEIARQNYERGQTLYEQRLLSEADYNALRQTYENARISHEAYAARQTSQGQAVAAPTNGYVKACLVGEGDYVEAGQPLLVLTQSRRLYLRADVPERHYAALRHVVAANFRTAYSPTVYCTDSLGGRLLSVGRTTGSEPFVPVVFELDNRGDLLPGSFATINLLGSERPSVLAIPRTALTEEQGLYFVYVQVDAEGYRKQEVRLGADNGREVEVLSGLHAGDRLVVRGAMHVKLAGASSAIPAHSHEH